MFFNSKRFYIDFFGHHHARTNLNNTNNKKNMEHKTLYELIKNFHGMYPEGATISNLLYGQGVRSDDKIYVRTKEEWIEKFKLTEELFASLTDVKIFKVVEYGLKVCDGHLNVPRAHVVTIFGLYDTEGATSSEVTTCIEYALKQRFKIKNP